MTHKSSQAASNRHSMEISAPVLISSSDPRAAARIGDLTQLSSSAPAQGFDVLTTSKRTTAALEELRGIAESTGRDEEKAEAFNAGFASVFDNTDRPWAARSPESEDHEGGNGDFPFVDTEIVRDQLCQLNVHKSMGPDGIHPRVRKELADVPAGPVSISDQRSWESGGVPADWKLASVIPTCKKGDSSSIGTATVAGPRTSAIIGDQGTPPKVQLPLNIYLALYAYKPQKNDELELRKGEMYRVIEKCQDGWFKGTSLRSGMSGVFPGNYVTPVSRVPVGAGQPRNSGAGGAPTTKGAPGAIHPIGAGHTNATTAVRPVVPITVPQTHPQLQAASPQLNNCLRYSAQQPASQTRNAMQMGTCVRSPVSLAPRRQD
nr:PREDICTED: SH3 domain-containing RING finger protein 3-like [Haliaeetus albicilla]